MHLDSATLQGIISRIDLLIQEALKFEKKFAAAATHSSFRNSKSNLLHYLSFRRHDLRELQEQLSKLGLSSLGRSEGHVMANLLAVRHQLNLLQTRQAAPVTKPATSFEQSEVLLQEHIQDLLGPGSPGRETRIMVTLGTEMATDYELVRQLLKTGMNCARINCAHDDKIIWEKMVKNIRRAEKELGIPCKILFDLMGPKLRTGPLKPGPKLVAVHPLRSITGQIQAPAKIWLSGVNLKPPVKTDAVLPVEPLWVNQLQPDDIIKFKDDRGRKRLLYVTQKETGGVVAHLFKTSYISTGTILQIQNRDLPRRITEVAELPHLEVPILLHKDDYLVLHKDLVPGEPAQLDEQGQVVQRAHIACTLPEIFTQVKAGQPVLFDDGEIEGEIQEVTKASLIIKITAAGPLGSRLRADKGINLPESNLSIDKLTDKDKHDLAFVAKHADVVNLSFVNQPAMVEALQAELQKLGASHLGIMLKIETKEGFRNLPHLLMTVMRSYPAGIMIARGDLAVECGWERLAEVQEEILWLCEAAHLPVVWATQVLEKLAKKGRPSRAEITDAAMSQRADCVMLNKGTYVVAAIEMLDGILKRMQHHQYKKTAMLRSLNVSEMNDFFAESNP